MALLPRPKPKPQTAAVVLQPTTASYADGSMGNGSADSARSTPEAWRIWRAVGEIHYSTTYMARQVARLRWDVTLNNAEKPLKPEQSDEMIRLVCGQQGVDKQTMLMALHRQVAGEYNYQRDKDSGEWFCRAVTKSSGSNFGPYGEGQQQFDITVHTINRDPYNPRIPDSPVLASMDVSLELMLLRALSRSQARNRTAQRGILLYPQEVTWDEDFNFEDELADGLTAALRDEYSAGAVVPGTLPVPKDLIDSFKHLTLASDFDKELPDRIDRCIKALAIQLDQPPEVLLGMTEANHWSAYVITDEIYEAHVQPLAEWPAWTLARAIELASNLPVGTVKVEADPSALLRRRPSTEEVFTAQKQGLVSDDYARAAIGAGPEDARTVPDDKQPLSPAVRTALDVVVKAPLLFAQPGGLPEIVRQVQAVLDGKIPTEPPETTGAAGPSGSGGAGRDTSGQPASGEGEPTKPEDVQEPSAPKPETAAAQAISDAQAEALGDQLARIDQQLMVSLATATESAFDRWRSAAGARMRTLVRNDAKLTSQIKLVDNDLVPATLGQDTVRTLLGNWLPDTASLERQATKLFTSTWKRVDAACGFAVCDPDSHMGPCQQWRTDAVQLLVSEAVAYLLQTLTQPAPGTGRLSEVARRSTVMAGGSHDPRVASLGKPGQLGSGPATNRTVMEAIRKETGRSAQQWRWMHGSSHNSHPQHVALNGLFAGLEGVINRDGIDWFPGDHLGCLCVLAPAFGVSQILFREEGSEAA